MDNAIYSRKPAHARSDAFAKLRELYRRRVMGGCLRGGGAYKLLREQKRRKKGMRAKKTGRREREREKERGKRDRA